LIVVDSSVWIDNIRRVDTGQVRLLRSLEDDDVIAGDIVVLEVLRGVRSEREARVQEARFRAYGITPMLDPEIAVAAATSFRWLRARGVTVRSFADLIIATFCIAQGHHLLHSDRDFDHFERHLGLKVLQPA
jgi:hypothetical protein